MLLILLCGYFCYKVNVGVLWNNMVKYHKSLDVKINALFEKRWFWTFEELESHNHRVFIDFQERYMLFIMIIWLRMGVEISVSHWHFNWY